MEKLMQDFVYDFFADSGFSRPEAFGDAFATCAVLTLLTIVLSIATKWYSYVDCLWSVVPPVYVWIWAAHSGWNQRLLLMAGLSTLWGIRLTLNFARKGGYSGEEDYRWEVLKKRLGTGLVWHLFNIGFISIYQMGLIFGFCIPAYRAVVNDSPLHWLDLVCAGAFLFFLFAETVADEQQWQYYQKRTVARKKAAKGDTSLLVGDYKRGFLSSGLFRYSRHPNFFCEQSQWVMFFFIGVASSISAQESSATNASAAAAGGGLLSALLNKVGLGADAVGTAAAAPTSNADQALAFLQTHVLHWSGIGVVLLIALFQGSTAFTEEITASKYPSYREYQKRTSSLFPWFPGAPLKED